MLFPTLLHRLMGRRTRNQETRPRPAKASRPRRPVLPALEVLEDRLVLSGYTPLGLEQEFLQALNLARANPAAYGRLIDPNGTILGGDGKDVRDALASVAPSQPLAFNVDLIQSSRDHSTDMSVHNYASHTGSDGSTPFQRMTAAGFPWVGAAESIAGGYSTPEATLAALVIDATTPDLGHRDQLLSIGGAPDSLLDQTGVGYAVGLPGDTYTNDWTIDSGYTSNTQPILTGVAYNDLNKDGLYENGEGLGGVTITATGSSGTYQTTTWTSGGYSLPVPKGDYTVTASGGPLGAAVSDTVTVGSSNVEVDFNPSPLGAHFSVTNGQLTVTGNPSVNANDTITLSTSGGGVVLTLDGQTTQFAPGAITSIVVNEGHGNDIVNVAGTLANVPVTINLGSGTDAVNVSSVPSSPVTLNGGGGIDTLNTPANLPLPWTVDDGGSGGGTLGPVTFHSFQSVNGAPIYSETGSGWQTASPSAGYGYDNEVRYHLKGSGADTAAWAVSGLAAGSYEVEVTWQKNFDRTTHAAYQVYDGPTLLGTVTIDQTIAPVGVSSGGVVFQSLGHFNVASGQLRVVLSGDQGGVIVADAVRLVPIPSLPTLKPASLVVTSNAGGVESLFALDTSGAVWTRTGTGPGSTQTLTVAQTGIGAVSSVNHYASGRYSKAWRFSSS
ncbi:MAG TPA: CAP domain-containing protein, partial [Gemmataceae bacterium]|nr:CAP domain-containing protein [Gemmataceae bacterium]